MTVALGILVLFAIFAAGVWGMVISFRAGMKTKFFVSYSLLEFPFFMAAVCLGGLLADWLLDRQADWGVRMWSVAIICAVCGILYTIGFLIGLRKRSRNEGIIGQTQ